MAELNTCVMPDRMIAMHHSQPRETASVMKFNSTQNRTQNRTRNTKGLNHWLSNSRFPSAIAAAMFILVQPLANGATPDAESHIEFSTDFGANCVARSAKQIVVKNVHPTKSIKIKLFRYFGDVRQPGRSVYVLPPDTEALELGCDKIQGRSQRWDIHSAEFE